MGAEEGRLASIIGGAIARSMGWASRKPAVALILVLLLSSVALASLSRVEFEENLIQILPRGNPNTEASLNVSREFPGHHTYTALILKVDPEKWAKANAKLPHRMRPEDMQTRNPETGCCVGANNISDEVYIRGMEELFQFYRGRLSELPPGVTFFIIAWNSHVKLVNWSNEKAIRPPGTNVDYAFAMPGTDPQGEMQFALDWQTVIKVAPSEVTTQASPKWDSMRAVFTYEPPVGGELSLSTLGQWFIDTTDAYKAEAAAGRLRWDVFDDGSLSIFDSKVVVDAHQNQLARKNLSILGPLVALFVLISLWVAFRSWKPIAIGMSSLVLGVVWTFGLMVYFDIPLNVLNLTVVPLILGVGIDFSIHLINEFAVLKSEGLQDAAAFREVGRRGGFSMFLATLTTIAGLVVMIYSPSLLIAQLGIVSSLALTIVYVLSIIFIPAALTLLGTSGLATQYRPSLAMAGAAIWVSRRRAAVGLLVAFLTVGLLVGTQFNDYETFGNPARNFPPGDEIRQQQETANKLLYSRDNPDTVSNWIIIEGDITDPGVHSYIRELSRKLAAHPSIRDDSVVSLVNVLSKWIAIKSGSPAALVNLGQEATQPGSTYPATRDSMKRELDSIYASPFATYASLFVNRGYSITVILVDLTADTTYAGASEAWDNVWGIIDGAKAAKPAHARVAMGGYTAYSYLFIKYEMPWVQTMAIVTNLVVVVLVFVLSRDWRATAVVGLVNLLATTWWLGLLPWFDIGLSVTLTMPLVFISCIGSDYALHLAWDLRRGVGLRETFGTVGKAVLFSAATDIGAFALFVPMENLMMRRSMLATCIAILAIFVLTLLTVPLFYRERRRRTAVVAAPAPVET